MSYGAEINGRPFELAADTLSPEASFARDEELTRTRSIARHALDGLSERERRIFERRCLSETTTTLAELGSELSISRERVRQLGQRAYLKVTETIAATCAV